MDESSEKKNITSKRNRIISIRTEENRSLAYLNQASHILQREFEKEHWFMYGIVKEYNEERGFGFLEDEMNHEIFFHVSGLALEAGQKLKEGMKVSYEIATGAKGPQAVQVKIENE